MQELQQVHWPNGQDPGGGKSYDPAHRTDEARKLIGLTLLALLVLIVAMGFVFLIGVQSRGLDHSVVAAIHSDKDAERIATLMKINNDQAKADADRLALLLNIIF